MQPAQYRHEVSLPGLPLLGPTFQTRPGAGGSDSTFVRMWSGYAKHGDSMRKLRETTKLPVQ